MNGKFVLAVYVDNKFGVLERVTSMFTRRGFNIDTLTVGVTESPEFSRITISMSGDEYVKKQMVNQLRKLYNVKRVELMEDDEAVERELLLVKVKNNTETQRNILSALDIFKARIIDYSLGALCVEVTGSSGKIDAFIEMIRPCGIIEVCRTGVVALRRGDAGILEHGQSSDT